MDFNKMLETTKTKTEEKTFENIKMRVHKYVTRVNIVEFQKKKKNSKLKSF